jgi:signal peptidase II
MDPTKDPPEASPLGETPSESILEHQIARGEVPEEPLMMRELPADLAAHLEHESYGVREPVELSASSEWRADGELHDVNEAPPSAPLDSLAYIPDSARPSFRFFGVVAALSLIADITSKVWAEVVINQRGFEPIKIVGENISITLAYNQGGAWGLFAGADEMVRKPFFLGVSAFAIFFIISLYSRLHPSQRALKWGLPLVLGGALGNLSDRITRSQVIDFIDYRGDWVMSLNSFVHKYFKSWAVTDHWPTFNVADIAICIGVGLMAVDMFTHRPRHLRHSAPPPESPPNVQSAEPVGPVVS